MTTQAKPKFYFSGIRFNSSYYDTVIDNTITKVAVATQYIKIPINNATGPLSSVLTLTNTTTKETTWVLPSAPVTNYVNYDTGTSTLISNVSSPPSTITNLVIENIGKTNTQKFALPNNTSTAMSGDSLSIDPVTRQTYWQSSAIILPDYVSYDSSNSNLLSNGGFGMPTIINSISIGGVSTNALVCTTIQNNGNTLNCGNITSGTINSGAINANANLIETTGS